MKKLTLILILCILIITAGVALTQVNSPVPASTASSITTNTGISSSRTVKDSTYFEIKRNIEKEYNIFLFLTITTILILSIYIYILRTSSQEEKEGLKEKIKQLKDELAGIDKDKKKPEEQIAKFEEEKKNFQGQINKLEEEKKYITQQIAKFEEEKKNFQEQIGKLEEEKKKFPLEISEIEEEKKRFQGQINKLEEEKKDFIRQINRLEEEKKNLNIRIEKIEEDKKVSSEKELKYKKLEEGKKKLEEERKRLEEEKRKLIEQKGVKIKEEKTREEERKRLEEEKRKFEEEEKERLEQERLKLEEEKRKFEEEEKERLEQEKLILEEEKRRLEEERRRLEEEEEERKRFEEEERKKFEEEEKRKLEEEEKRKQKLAAHGEELKEYQRIIKEQIATKTKSIEHPADKSEMILIPEGEFVMGSTEDEVYRAMSTAKEYYKGAKLSWFTTEMPHHKVHLNEYYMDKKPVTNSQYKKFLEESGYKSQGDWKAYYSEDKDDHPVVNITWYDAKAYAEWTGKRLPTEAEWEKAARGDDERLWPWGQDWDVEKCNSRLSNINTTTPVTKYLNGSSRYDILDMSGNVWEWCNDWFEAEYYKESPDKNPQGPDEGKEKVLRGGSWTNYPNYLRSTSRYRLHPDNCDHSKGFRCVISPEDLE